MPDNAFKIFSGTIPNGTKISGEIVLDEVYYPAMIKYPAMTTSVALNFEVMFTADEGSDGSYVELKGSDGTAYALTIVAGAAGVIALDPTIFYCIKRLKVKVADNQTGDKAINIIGRQY